MIGEGDLKNTESAQLWALLVHAFASSLKQFNQNPESNPSNKFN